MTALIGLMFGRLAILQAGPQKPVIAAFLTPAVLLFVCSRCQLVPVA